ncbi:putative reverse transcriptase domain-containing protein [Tanacetum coccineum]|uniref:Reverse transcriptase domain-containing protein n=1 Tax=Tanacetum coccineum TaxID=301880 RepID=A0ABQ5H5A7_9ASTR
MCIDYRDLNILTSKEIRLTTRQIDDLFDQLQGSSIYSKKRSEIRDHSLGTEQTFQRRHFRTLYWPLRVLVDPLGLTNHLRTKGSMITPESNSEIALWREVVCKVFKMCVYAYRRYKFFWTCAIDSRGIQVTRPRARVYQRIGHLPKTPTEIRQFLGLAGYYRRFIEGFLKIAKSRTKLTQKEIKFDWGEKEENAFQLIKQKLCSAPILALPEGSEDFVVYCDASHKGLGFLNAAREGNKHKVVADALSRSPTDWPELIKKQRKDHPDEAKMQAAQDRQKATLTKRKRWRRSCETELCSRSSPWKGVVRFGKRGKLNPRYVGPFKVLAKVVKVAGTDN